MGSFPYLFNRQPGCHLYNDVCGQKNHQQFPFFSLIQSLWEQTHNKIFAGIGIGIDTLKAEYNAEQAIQFTDAKANPCAYVMFTDGQLLGPLLQSDRMPLKFSTSADHPALLKLSEQTNLSAVTLTRLLSLQSHHPKAGACQGGRGGTVSGTA
ncbi:hypothetical protein [Brevibacillus massiliensis]|uniref:hypothetical protein n=1 Tax=Brevibacillus massiliensis TaxID=1118054 RepID=UPI0005500D46|nr:hypothetical protein [Brevibacillus massiliensis]